MKKVSLVLLAALLLGSARPLPAPALPVARIVISGDVYGFTRSGQSAPIGSYIAYGETLAEALQNAEALDRQVREQATAQALP